MKMIYIFEAGKDISIPIKKMKIIIMQGIEIVIVVIMNICKIHWGYL